MSGSVRKPRRLDHVKFVKKTLKTGVVWFAYFNTGVRNEGKPVYSPLPRWGTPGFWDSYNTHMGHRSRRAVPTFSVADMIARYQASAQYERKRPNTKKLYANQLVKIADLFGDFPPNNITPSHVRRALDGSGFPAGTYNTVLAVLGALFTWGRRQNLTEANPTKDIERMEGGSWEPWPEDVLEAALESEDDTVRLAVHLLYFTGQRIGDVLKMRWGDIRNGRITVVQEKTGKTVEPPILPELQAELDRTPRKGFYIMEGATDRDLRRKLQAFTKSHGAKTVPHGLRKNAVNSLLEEGCTIAEVASITGQTYAIVEHYAARVNTKKLSQAAMLKFERSRAK